MKAIIDKIGTIKILKSALHVTLSREWEDIPWIRRKYLQKTCLIKTGMQNMQIIQNSKLRK